MARHEHARCDHPVRTSMSPGRISLTISIIQMLGRQILFERLLWMHHHSRAHGMTVTLVIVTLLALNDPVKVLGEPTSRGADPPKTFALEPVDEYVKAQVRENGYAGLSLAIAREGKIVLAKGYGKRTIEGAMPVGPETMFAVGSLTKQFTCACILLLAEDGKVIR